MEERIRECPKCGDPDYLCINGYMVCVNYLHQIKDLESDFLARS